ncbi:hypothetical protein VFPBJ_08498 [Purpureocillium lilacinum]|uniref:Uncharacterized protein n=1 Tax=Purpureocillium lilacinum TaxID=33203 RepID=A0A179GF42_PURLI|nr:hypothetical protein VFPBJ_08498 [Purpureocillium lilacinum]
MEGRRHSMRWPCAPARIPRQPFYAAPPAALAPAPPRFPQLSLTDVQAHTQASTAAAAANRSISVSYRLNRTAGAARGKKQMSSCKHLNAGQRGRGGKERGEALLSLGSHRSLAYSLA